MPGDRVVAVDDGAIRCSPRGRRCGTPVAPGFQALAEREDFAGTTTAEPLPWKFPYFLYYRNMETLTAAELLAALGHESRLSIYRALVEAGPRGLHAGAIGERLGLPAPTLSFHLAHLSRVGLARRRQEGRFVIYAADFPVMSDLLGFLTANCCGGNPCMPGAGTPTIGEARIPRACAVPAAGEDA